jgi:hypothetical protein
MVIFLFSIFYSTHRLQQLRKILRLVHQVVVARRRNNTLAALDQLLLQLRMTRPQEMKMIHLLYYTLMTDTEQVPFNNFLHVLLEKDGCSSIHSVPLALLGLVVCGGGWLPCQQRIVPISPRQVVRGLDLANTNDAAPRHLPHDKV